ncbi:uncharacterized protein GVI51_L03289 [Nakaseomyces glabratus]|uniref:Potassium channel domain-containing protein n=2 Tax=Candida glabrata TaxID=5478 RepID=Q6FLH0_CANGA|nr:uncharacterized protein CAGL0L03476g [Nakaseomyces glabratus]KAH7595404.1 Ion channel [Nakaseomyces glabratus]KAH7601836.1 Ion channel [Nakaseomyces glabratus]KTB01135.1 Outward-rectifier potassium channel TOK1 [Nakaseomyces glabratus]KTB04901.1 Outward-rectifier potassium channel TOK1 [Nakaseomyces glabratus]KTB08537.1 Outward-rectifier potassium channel TOK1 [Nakaseomyces glabratus]|eukprot:XP_448924.1 uncharacterized protein CAGL0L03476g [[Candida] glabrata]
MARHGIEREDSVTSELARLERIFSHHRINHDTVLKDALQFSNERVTIINANPASKEFGFWFIVSCYFPVITACLGPVANTISIACAVDKWRVNYFYVEGGGDKVFTHIDDPRGVFAVNIISLVIGCCSNAVLFLHFARKLSYLKSQIINIVGWTLAGGMLMIDVIVLSTHNIDETYQEKTIGFWYAAITSGLYLCCTLTLSIHFVGHKLQKYPAQFNLLPNERSIMVFTVILSIWLIWGAGMFSRLLHISYGNALYFCTVSLLTIGLGDILPKSTAAKCMALVFSMTGVLILGIIVFMTRSILQTSAGPIFFFHRVEHRRVKAWEKLTRGDCTLTDKECFELMMSIRRTSKMKGHIYSLMITIIIFILFWILGATVFYFAEGWTYFNAVYFCFLCLLTIGYGDYAPETGAGRAFFVLWSIGAVPLMGAILSTAGDLLYASSESLDVKLGKWLKNSVKTVLIGPNLTKKQSYTSSSPLEEQAEVNEFNFGNDDGIGIIDSTFNNDEDSQSTVSDNIGDPINIRMASSNNNNNVDGLHTLAAAISRSSSYRRKGASSGSNRRRNNSIKDEVEKCNREDEVFEGTDLFGDIRTEREKITRLNQLVKVLKRLHEMSLNDKDKKLNYNDWSKIHHLALKNLNNDGIDPNPTYWLSEYSPLKFPLNQPHYAFMKIMGLMDRTLRNLAIDESMRGQSHFREDAANFMINPFNRLPVITHSEEQTLSSSPFSHTSSAASLTSSFDSSNNSVAFSQDDAHAFTSLENSESLHNSENSSELQHEASTTSDSNTNTFDKGSRSTEHD